MVRGGVRLRGQVRVNGAKNATLPILAACLLTPSECVVLDAPRLRDTAVMQQILTSLGARVGVECADRSRRALVVRADALNGHEVPDHLVGEMRSSIFLMGPLLGRVGGSGFLTLEAVPSAHDPSTCTWPG